MKDEQLHTSLDDNFKLLNKIGAISSSFLVVIIIIQFIVFVVAPPPSEGAQAWFTLFQKDKLLGLVSFELLMVVYTILSMFVSLALSVVLLRTNKSLVVIYLAISLVGIICFIVSRPAFEMLSLSSQYTIAKTEIQKTTLLAAGENILAIFHGTTFYISYILGSIAGLIISIVMLQSKAFSKAAAYTRITSSIFDFGLFIPIVGLYISLFSVVFLLIFNILVARRLYKLG
jgi:hypothetical protein